MARSKLNTHKITRLKRLNLVTLRPYIEAILAVFRVGVEVWPAIARL